jgi:hypothetical protein
MNKIFDFNNKLVSILLKKTNENNFTAKK